MALIGNRQNPDPQFYTNLNLSNDDVWSNLFASGRITQSNYQDVNKFLKSHYDLAQATQYLPGTKAVSWENDPKKRGIFNYQTNYHTNYGFGTPTGFSGANWENSYNNDSLNTGDRWIKQANGEYKWNGADNVFGEQTWRRRASYYTPEEVQRINNKIKQYGFQFVVNDWVNTSTYDTDGRRTYMLEPLDNDDAIEVTDDKIKNPDETVPTTIGVTSSNSTPTTTSNNTFNNPNNALSYTPNLPKIASTAPAKSGWSDWIPLTLQLLNDYRFNWREYKNATSRKFPLQEAPYLNYKITDDYYTRQQLNQNAANIRSQGDQNLSSDLRQNLKQHMSYEDQANKLDTQSAQLKSQSYARTAQNAEQVANQNILYDVNTANNNIQANTASWNNILNARTQKAQRDLIATNSYIGNMYTSFGEKLKTDRLNQNAYKAANYREKAQNASYDLYNSYTNQSQLGNWSGLQNAYNQYKTLVDTGTGWDENWTNLTDEQKNQVYAWIQNDPQANAIRLQYQQYLQALQKDYLEKNRSIEQWQTAALGTIPLYSTNQWDPIIQPRTASTAYRKKGGSLSHLQAIVQREQESIREQQSKRNEATLRHLDKELDRLNRETLLLLKSVFK